MNYLENRAKRAIVPISNSIAKVQGSLQTGSSDDLILFIVLSATVASKTSVAVAVILHNIQKHGAF